MAITVRIPKKKYDEMLDYIDRLHETVEILSDKKTVKILNDAISRIEQGEYLTKDDMAFSSSLYDR
ncbi:MAG: hypothetical protein ACOC32_04065 [Nanoarchaeota archaeon]